MASPSDSNQRIPAMRIALKNIVYLTDFSHPSEMALPYAKAMAQAFDAKVYALHVLVPDVVSYMTPESPAAALEAMGKVAARRMGNVDEQFANLPHESIVAHAESLWSVLEAELRKGADLVVLGTHGRTGVRRFLMGSTAERVLRKSGVPVMIIGPGVRGAAAERGKLRRILLATDLGHDSEKATSYAVSLAQENQAELLLLHVIERPGRRNRRQAKVLSVAEAMHQLQTLLPNGAELWCKTESAVELGQAGAQIVEKARRSQADLIVLGVREAEDLFTATHLSARTAHEVIARATCPVLCVPTPEAKFH
jgi:nucleotide-binding universal stress UspA family protein